MSEEPDSSGPRDVVRADELESRAKPSRFGRRLVALTFVGLVAVYIISARPWETEEPEDPTEPADQRAFVLEAREFWNWAWETKRNLPNPFDDEILTLEAEFGGERRIKDWLGMAMRIEEDSGRQVCIVRQGFNFILCPSHDDPFEMPTPGNWVQFDGTLTVKFTRNLKDYLYVYITVDRLEVLR